MYAAVSPPTSSVIGSVICTEISVLCQVVRYRHISKLE